MNDNNEKLQYNSCTSKGICSINPRTFALQNVLGLYLNLCAKYSLKLQEKNALSQSAKEFILNTISVSVSNPEFTEEGFVESITKLKKILPKLIKTYNTIYNADDFKGEDILSSDLFKKCENITDAIKLGENIYKNKVSNVPVQTRDLLKILLIIAKSIGMNILDIESYGTKTDMTEGAFVILLTILDSLNKEDNDFIKELAEEGAKYNTELMKLLHSEQEKRYGEQVPVKISYTTTPSKAVLVVGSNIIELENILEALKDTDIDVYTHDEMMAAHTFPKFKEYKNLKGQYGHGLENCLIDFATFPGPIILTKHSLHNVENFYRGHLFTTDINLCKGVIKIENNDYREVISLANNSKGFKTGKICETVNVGYSYEKCIELIDKKLNSKTYKKVVIIGLKDYSNEQKEYFEKLVKLLSDEVLIISFSYNFKRDNLLYFNVCFDSFAVVRMALYLLGLEPSLSCTFKPLPTDVFLPKCGRNTLAEMIYFAKFPNVAVYMGECNPIAIDPSMINTLKNSFKISSINNAKNDSEIVNDLSKY